MLFLPEKSEKFGGALHRQRHQVRVLRFLIAETGRHRCGLRAFPRPNCPDDSFRSGRPPGINPTSELMTSGLPVIRKQSQDDQANHIFCYASTYLLVRELDFVTSR